MWYFETQESGKSFHIAKCLNSERFQVLGIAIGTEAKDSHSGGLGGLYAGAAIFDNDALRSVRPQLPGYIKIEVREWFRTRNHIRAKDSAFEGFSQTNDVQYGGDFFFAPIGCDANGETLGRHFVYSFQQSRCGRKGVSKGFKEH